MPPTKQKDSDLTSVRGVAGDLTASAPDRNGYIFMEYLFTVAFDEAVDDRVAALIQDSSSITWTYDDGANTLTAIISATYGGQASIATLGTITTGTWNATTVAVAYGGTGQTSYTNGQLLIGNTTGNTLTKATLTAGTGITITNSTGSITIGATVAQDYTNNFLLMGG